MPESPTQRPSIWRRAVLSAVVTVGLLIGGELGLTVFDVANSALYAGDPGWYWTLHKDLNLPAVDHLEEGQTFSVRTSSDGLRDGEWPQARPVVLALGCSTTFGWGVEAEDAWPEQLEARLGASVINAGIPGHSSHQGRRFAAPLLDRAPDVAILAWGVRDADSGSAMDADAQPTRFPRTTRLYRLLRDLLPERRRGAAVVRVPASDFAHNVAAVMAQAAERGVAVILLDFPSAASSPAHASALRQVAKASGALLLAPTLPRDGFFANDPIHLNATGHRRLAELLEVPVRAVLTRGS
jgi:lysophospholipase L1-like esterase